MIKNYLYKGIDSIVLQIFRRAKYYRDLGLQYKTYAGQTLPKIFNSLNKDHSNFLEENLKPYGNYAYLEVQGQTALIDMDICGIKLEERQPDANKAALTTGLVWFAIKLIDNYIDKYTLTNYKLIDFLNLTKESWKENKQIDSKYQEEKILINSTHNLLYSGYLGEPSHYMGSLEELADAEIKYSSSPKTKRIVFAKEEGIKAAQLTINLIQQYILEYPGIFRNFILEQGRTARLIDDFKDRSIDKKLGRGYNSDLYLALNVIKHFIKHFSYLPTIKSKWRNLNFIVLAELFHIREILGVKESA